MRKLGDSAIVYLRGASAKRFMHSTLPIRSSEVTYYVHAVRSTAAHAFATLPVTLRDTGWTAIASGADATPVKLAA